MCLESEIMATVTLKNVMKIYPYSGDEERKAKRAREKEGVSKKTNLQITDEGVVAVQEFSLDIKDKEFVLDIDVLLNDNTKIGLEMQVQNKHNWTERSLAYLCRSFDQLYRGQEYEEALPVIHIGFTAFTLFPDNPEFYATYRMINIRNHSQVYSDKFTLSVVDLTQINRATEEEKKNGLLN